MLLLIHVSLHTISPLYWKWLNLYLQFKWYPFFKVYLKFTYFRMNFHTILKKIQCLLTWNIYQFIYSLAQWLMIWHGHELCCVGHRCGSDPTLLWLWHRPAAAAQILPLAWELPCAMGVTLKRHPQNFFKLHQTTRLHCIAQGAISNLLG